MPHFAHDGIQFHYCDSGAGVPVVFQHGLGGDASELVGLFQPPLEFQLLSVDFRAHGETRPLGPPKKIGMATFADDLVALLDELAVDRAVLGGISMGGPMKNTLLLVLVIVRTATATPTPPPPTKAENPVSSQSIDSMKAKNALPLGEIAAAPLGPYLWADGEKGRKTDDLIYRRKVDRDDGNNPHPSDAGSQKIANNW
jgi:hypothetical protein